MRKILPIVFIARMALAAAFMAALTGALPGPAQLASAQSGGAENGCEYSQSFGQAREASQAIFLGSAVEEKWVHLAAKGGADLSYRLVKFEVEKSWKAADKKIVWIRVAAPNPGCGFDALNATYLVYADRINDELFISRASRTMPVQMAASDLSLLGEPAVTVTGGEYKLFSILIWGLAIVFAIALAVAFYIFRLSGRPLE